MFFFRVQDTPDHWTKTPRYNHQAAIDHIEFKGNYRSTCRAQYNITLHNISDIRLGSSETKKTFDSKFQKYKHHIGYVDGTMHLNMYVNNILSQTLPT